jgi:hypothetical protein
MKRERRGTLLQTDVGSVTAVEAVWSGVQQLAVKTEAGDERAINYVGLLGEAEPGEQVLLNTTAVRAKLGTGGYHFVMKRAGKDRPAEAPGHIVKLRYTPLQFRCATVEEQDSPYREAIESCEELERMPVIAAALHSQVAPAAAAVKGRVPSARVVYIMTDAAALPLAFSKLVPSLKEAGLLDATITVGQAFGGDHEAVNVYSGLLAAKAAFGADVAIVGQGPGNVGTETEWGFGSIAQGDHINAAGVLGGLPIAVPRISFADPRPRHRGVSSHTLVVLGQVALVRAAVSVPAMAEERLALVHQQLDDAGVTARHDVLVVNGEAGLQVLQERGIEARSMGRTPEDDPEFFLAAGAAGALAAEALDG